MGNLCTCDEEDAAPSTRNGGKPLQMGSRNGVHRYMSIPDATDSGRGRRGQTGARYVPVVRSGDGIICDEELKQLNGVTVSFCQSVLSFESSFVNVVIRVTEVLRYSE